MNGIHLPIIHPRFESLKKNGKVLHLLAAVLIVVHAVSHFNEPGFPFFYFACLLLIAIDILLLVVVTRNSLSAIPKVNLAFRGIECVFFIGIGTVMLYNRHWFTGASHLVIGIFYCYLFYCERKLGSGEFLGIFHTGISIPAIPDTQFLLWSNISSVEANYSSIRIITSDQSVEFDLKENLQFGELDQIHEFCRHYLGRQN